MYSDSKIKIIFLVKALFTFYHSIIWPLFTFSERKSSSDGISFLRSFRYFLANSHYFRSSLPTLGIYSVEYLYVDHSELYDKNDLHLHLHLIYRLI